MVSILFESKLNALGISLTSRQQEQFVQDKFYLMPLTLEITIKICYTTSVI